MKPDTAQRLHPAVWGAAASLLLACSFRSAAASAAEAQEVLDLLEAFGSAQVAHPKLTELRRPARAGGVAQDALFVHPAAPNKPGRVAYTVELPKLASDELLLLVFQIALADGVQLRAQEDGVRFGVELEGQRVFARRCRQTRWEPHGVDLSAWAGRRVTLTLVTDGLANTSYDWALWGSPQLLLLPQAQRMPVKRDQRVSVPAGVLAFRYPSRPCTVRVQADGSGSPLEWNIPVLGPDEQSGGWVACSFSFTAAPAVQVTWEPPEGLDPAQVLVAPYPARPEVSRFGPARALVMAGQPTPLWLELKNTGRGALPGGAARLIPATATGLKPIEVPSLAPGETWRAQWSWEAPTKPGLHSVKVALRMPEATIERTASFEVWGRPADLRTLQNDRLKIEFARQPRGYAYATVYARQGRGWVPVALWQPLMQLVSDTRSGPVTWEVQPRSAPAVPEPGCTVNNSVQFIERARDADGVEWTVGLTVKLLPEAPVARIRYQWQAAQDRKVRAVLGPQLYVGEGTAGEAKSWGLFPGLEFLYGPEPSSNSRDFDPALADRRTPDPLKITVPLMAVTLSPDSLPPPQKPDRFFCPDALKDQAWRAQAQAPAALAQLQQPVTVALLWNPLQRWDGQHAFPAARFASPNFDQGLANHRLALFLPSVPDYVPENGTVAGKAYALAAGQTLTLEATLCVAPGSVLTAVRQWLAETGGLPQPHPWPRPFAEALAVCRTGLLQTVWDTATGKWRHCMDWAPTHAPGLAALLWVDAQIDPDPEPRHQARARVELAVTNMLRDGGPGLLTSPAACHLMQWELPFLYGYLAEAMPAIDRYVAGLIRSQRPHGGWVFTPANPQQKDLGAAGDSVLGLCAHHAMTLARYARLTGDTNALAAAEKALRFMEQFRVPRGAQTWECPMYEPDILAAAYAVRAYHEAWRATGQARWLHNAVYWAETGVPFVYLWGLPDKPMMLGATIPVFGSTFYTHSWLGMPVQWCGLVYACHVWRLAEELARVPLPHTDSPLPLSLRFGPADWRRLAELITVSGLYQQFADGPRVGTYPDSISGFQQRNPAFLNPENIMVNLLLWHGVDPDVHTARVLSPAGPVVVSSGARILNARLAAGSVRFDLSFFEGEPSHTLVAGLKPKQVFVDGRALARLDTPPRRAAGWWWDAATGRAYLVVPHPQATVGVEVVPE